MIRLTSVLICVALSVWSVASQKAPTAIFAVLDSGKYVEPVAIVESGQLKDMSETPNFGKLFYAAKTNYNLIFGSGIDGKVTIAKSLIGTECAGRTAEVNVTDSKAQLSTYVMALATNLQVKKAATLRRLPTAEERAEIEALVRTEFKKNKMAASSLKQLRYHNLTAVDIDRDGSAELIGSFWVAPSSKNRRLLFFVAEKGSDGKYVFGLSHYGNLNADKVMSGDVKDLDNGILHELLVETLDFDGDGIAEVFTTTQAFEGRNFQVYRRDGGRWSSIFKSYNYRCGY